MNGRPFVTSNNHVPMERPPPLADLTTIAQVTCILVSNACAAVNPLYQYFSGFVLVRWYLLYCTTH